MSEEKEEHMQNASHAQGEISYPTMTTHDHEICSIITLGCT